MFERANLFACSSRALWLLLGALLLLPSCKADHTETPSPEKEESSQKNDKEENQATRNPELVQQFGSTSIHAIGSSDETKDEVLKAALIPDPMFFSKLPAPRPGDWLTEHPERGQSYGDFLQRRAHRPDETRKTIYLQPLCGAEEWFPQLTQMTAFLEAFFQLQVEVLPPLEIEKSGITSRTNGGVKQFLAGEILDMLEDQLPQDAYVLIGLTSADLYPGEDWNYVFGQASLVHRVGVQSLARYDPRFYDPEAAPNDQQTATRTYKILAHEVGHMFGMEHCVHFACLMQGANSLSEMDKNPAHLCPVCLHKLAESVPFHPVARYQELSKSYEEVGVEEVASWFSMRAASLEVESSRPRP